MVAAESNEGDQEDRALSVLKSATKAAASSTIQVSNRQAYENRLLSFQAATYYAKPACLSPLICARFGYVKCLSFIKFAESRLEPFCCHDKKTSDGYMPMDFVS